MSAIVTENISAAGGQAGPRLKALRDVAGQVVGSVFYGQLLRNLRDSSLKGQYGHGGRGEEVFQAQMDQFLAEEAGQARGFDLAEAIYQRFANRVSASVHRPADQELTP